MNGDADFWPKLVVGILATWRIAHILAHEDGPAALIARARAALGERLLGRMLDCFHCVSLWVAAPIALWVTMRLIDACLVWLALSGAACLCERLRHPEVLMQHLPEPSEGEHDGMLRPKT
jgi:hypothetical protein